MDELPPPSGAEEPLSLRGDDRALAIYRGSHSGWAERVTAGEFVAADPILARCVSVSGQNLPQRSASWLGKFALPLTVAVFIVGLLLAGDWKIEHLFTEPATGDDPTRTLPVKPMARAAIPAGALGPVTAVNEALITEPVNWRNVLVSAEALRGSPSGKASPAVQVWLSEVLVGAHMQLAEGEPHRLGHYEAVVRLDREFGPAEAKRPYGLAFSACVALFECAGGSRDLYLGQASTVPPVEVLDAVARIRSGYPAELVKSAEQQRQLARVESYTLLRQIVPRRVWWWSHAPFDENDPPNRETWTRLADALTRWKKMERDRPSRDLDQLQRVFWQAIDAFCTWPTRWKDDFVTIGNRTYQRADARAVLDEVMQRQRPQ
jgi:hypothetical protein